MQDLNDLAAVAAAVSTFVIGGVYATQRYGRPVARPALHRGAVTRP